MLDPHADTVPWDSPAGRDARSLAHRASDLRHALEKGAVATVLWSRLRRFPAEALADDHPAIRAMIMTATSAADLSALGEALELIVNREAGRCRARRARSWHDRVQLMMEKGARAAHRWVKQGSTAIVLALRGGGQGNAL